MNGCVIPNTPFAVDFWNQRLCPSTKLFFLSHMHADHTCGLSSSWKSAIYCSEITGRLLTAKFGIQDHLVRTLATNESHVIYLDEEQTESMTVSLIDANHCPGAVMFLFQGYFGTILYTGDFRHTPEMFVDTPLSGINDVDDLYLDNTYCDPACDFPSRDEAKKEIFDIISAHPNHDIYIGTHNLGKEDLLLEIALNFQTWIVVTQEKLNTLKQLELPNVFTTDKSEGRIHALLQYHISGKSMAKWNEQRQSIGIIPTAIYGGIGCKPHSNHKNIFIVPYSDHSSYNELKNFVSAIKPREIIPIIKKNARGPFGIDISKRADMLCFDQYLDKTPKVEFSVPHNVKRFMALQMHHQVIPRKRTLGQKSNSLMKRGNQAKGVVFISQSPCKGSGEIPSPVKKETNELRVCEDNTKDMNIPNDENITKSSHLESTDASLNQTLDGNENITASSDCTDNHCAGMKTQSTKKRKLPLTFVKHSPKKRRTGWLSTTHHIQECNAKCRLKESLETQRTIFNHKEFVINGEEMDQSPVSLKPSKSLQKTNHSNNILSYFSKASGDDVTIRDTISLPHTKKHIQMPSDCVNNEGDCDIERQHAKCLSEESNKQEGKPRMELHHAINADNLSTRNKRTQRTIVSPLTSDVSNLSTQTDRFHITQCFPTVIPKKCNMSFRKLLNSFIYKDKMK